MEYVLEVSLGPRLVPSSLNCTPATAMLSDAVAETVTVPDTELFAAGVVIDAVGGVVSGGGGVRKGKSPDTARVPAASRERDREWDKGPATNPLHAREGSGTPLASSAGA